MSSVRQRARGCLLGQLIGDALGSQVEFRSKESITKEYPDGLRDLNGSKIWNTIPGSPTDDSEMSLSLARSIVTLGRYDREAVTLAYFRWFRSHPFDIGRTTLQALSSIHIEDITLHRAWSTANRSADDDSQANGALMRISPLGIASWRHPDEWVERDARQDAMTTHPHSICQDASALLAVTIAYAVRTGACPILVFRYAASWAVTNALTSDVGETLARSRSRPDDYQSQQGWVLIALQNCFYQLLHAPTLEEGIVDTVMQGGDTDTNAAIAGALLGAVHGERNIPNRWRRTILTCRPGKRTPQPRPRVYWPYDAIKLADQLMRVER